MKNMLTKSDLSQIKDILQEETPRIIQEEVGKVIGEKLTPIGKDIKTIKKDVNRIKRDLKATISFFDTEYIELRKDVDKIKTHIRFQTA